MTTDDRDTEADDANEDTPEDALDDAREDALGDISDQVTVGPRRASRRPLATDGGSDDVPSDRDDLLEALHDHLAATQELPVERGASRWIGEAEAVAADLASADLDDEVVAERLQHVVELLAEVEDTGHPLADEHVDVAAELADAGLSQVAD